MRIGYFGGSFDPVHFGHLVLAEACLDGARLDRVVFLPAGSPPHKQGRDIANANHRLEMLRLAIDGIPQFSIDDREVSRAGVSYTVDTVRDLLANTDAANENFWLIGGDTLPDLPTWRDIEGLLDIIPFLTASRPGYDTDAALSRLKDVFGPDRADDLAAGIVHMPLVGVSSTGIRARLRSGRSIRFLVPEPVREYISRHHLYLPSA